MDTGFGESEDDEQDNPDVRHPQSVADKKIACEEEFSDSDDGAEMGGARHTGNQVRKHKQSHENAAAAVPVAVASSGPVEAATPMVDAAAVDRVTHIAFFTILQNECSCYSFCGC